MLVEIDEKIYGQVKKLVEEYNIDYPNIKNFVNRAVREKIHIDSRRKALGK